MLDTACSYPRDKARYPVVVLVVVVVCPRVPDTGQTVDVQKQHQAIVLPGASQAHLGG
jgi:hypothetical protein